MRYLNIIVLIIIAILGVPAFGFGQWVHYPTVAVPRKADGTPNLTARLFRHLAHSGDQSVRAGDRAILRSGDRGLPARPQHWSRPSRRSPVSTVGG
jgi:hypothetical protein